MLIVFSSYDDQVPAEADLVTYWVAKAWGLIRSGGLSRAGLVTTNSIRGGANRRVLEPIATDGLIFDAWDDEAWVVEGAAVRVSIICFTTAGTGKVAHLNGQTVPQINPDLKGTILDLTKAVALSENGNVAFMGDTKGGSFDVPGDLARQWLMLPLNPNGKSNAEVLRPWVNGMDITRRPADKWIIDFGWRMNESEAALFEQPFRHVLENVKPEREKNNRELYRRNWWRHVEARPGMWAALEKIPRYIVTCRVAKHRLFIWLQSTVCPDSATIAVARDDDTTFGILHSRFHEAWSLRLGSSLEDRPRYTPSTTFETFPFPNGLTPAIASNEFAADPRAITIAAAAVRLNELRLSWQNPPDLTSRSPEVVPGFPERILPINEEAAAILRGRTLTNLYNERPTWLANAHADLDAAVAHAYGWPADISEEDALARLFALNQERAATSRTVGLLDGTDD
jgi:type II restriction/modification system DNA methylase subunit YeeA